MNYRHWAQARHVEILLSFFSGPGGYCCGLWLSRQDGLLDRHHWPGYQQGQPERRGHHPCSHSRYKTVLNRSKQEVFMTVKGECVHLGSPCFEKLIKAIYCIWVTQESGSAKKPRCAAPLTWVLSLSEYRNAITVPNSLCYLAAVCIVINSWNVHNHHPFIRYLSNSKHELSMMMLNLLQYPTLWMYSTLWIWFWLSPLNVDVNQV